jgi:hypothetical protein
MALERTARRRTTVVVSKKTIKLKNISHDPAGQKNGSSTTRNREIESSMEERYRAVRTRENS